jgi:dihydroflavonol-4-reductase
MILVTGATGFVGEHVVARLLAEGFEVLAMYRNAALKGQHGCLPSNASEALRWVQADITDYFQLESILTGVHTIYHCAAMISYNPRERDQLFRANIYGTEQLVNAALSCGVKRLVYVSSIAALGESSEEHLAVDEKASWKTDQQHSNYAISKFRAENEVWRGMEEGLEVIIVNPSVILGPGLVNSGSNQLFRKVFQGLKFYSPGSTGFIDVRDVANAMVELNKANIIGQRWVLNGHNVAYRQLFTEMALALGVSPPDLAPPRWMSEIAWRLNALLGWLFGKQIFITRETVHAAYRKREFDGSAITRALPGFNYRSLADTLQAGAASAKSQLKSQSVNP